MSKKWVLICSSIAIVAITATITYSISYAIAMGKFNEKVAGVNERQAMYSKLSEIDQYVRQDFIGVINEDTLTDSICQGYIKGLSNKYSSYYSIEEYQIYNSIQSGKYVGVGVSLIKNSDRNLEVVYVEENSPASKAEVYKGDIISEIDGKSVKDLTLQQAELRLYGLKGSEVTLNLIRRVASEDGSGFEDKNLKISVTREKYKEQTVFYEIINENIGYVSITNFMSSTPKDYEHAINDMMSKGCSRFIIDLRHCKDGSVEYAAEILDTILPEGELISTIDKDDKKSVIRSSSAKYADYKIAVLVNSGTTCAGELFASSIKDYDRGVIIGEITAGETVKKETVALSDGSAVVIPTAHYVTLNGEILTGKGLQPTKYVDMTVQKRDLLERNNLQHNEDDQLNSAIESLS